MVAVLLIANPNPTVAQTEPEKALAQKRYKVGEQLYKISQYDKALIEFQEAYRIWPKHDMLFNIARCHEVLANLDKAIENYKKFLEKRPDSPNVPLVKTRIKSLENRLARKKKTEQDKAAGAKAERKPEPPTPAKAELQDQKPAPVEAPVVLPAPVASDHIWRWTAGWAGVGVGGAALVGGIAFGALASGKSSDYEELRDSGGLHDDLKEIRDTGEQYETIGIALMVSGGVIVAAGGALLIWELMGGEDDTVDTSAMFTPVVTQDGVGFAARLSF